MKKIRKYTSDTESISKIATFSFSVPSQIR